MHNKVPPGFLKGNSKVNILNSKVTEKYFALVNNSTYKLGV